MPEFEFATANRIIFGAGTLPEVGGLSAGLGQNALVALGKDTSRAEQLFMHLHSSGLKTCTVQIEGEPTVDQIKEGVSFARTNQIDLVIAYGGGSVIDAGKAISGLATNSGDTYDYLEVVGAGTPLTEKPLPFIAIPTTSGTGSEVTRNAVLGVPDKRVKVSLRSPLMLPTIALVDPELTYSLPANITAYTGMDALTQLIEPYVSKQANPFTDLFCLEGMRLVSASLERVYKNAGDTAARRDMTLASLYGGLALANAKLGAVHGLAGVLGGMFGAPHGAICAKLLPEVMHVNVHVLTTREQETFYLDRFRKVARVITGSQLAGSQEGVRWVKRLCGNLDIPGLSTYGVNESQFPSIIEKAQEASSMKGNPVELRPDELAEILERALS